MNNIIRYEDIDVNTIIIWSRIREIWNEVTGTCDPFAEWLVWNCVKIGNPKLCTSLTVGAWSRRLSHVCKTMEINSILLHGHLFMFNIQWHNMQCFCVLMRLWAVHSANSRSCEIVNHVRNPEQIYNEISMVYRKAENQDG